MAVEVATLQGEVRSLPADVLLPFFGLAMDLGPIAEWGIALERHHVPVTAATCETSLPGVFAIGDVAHYAGKLKLILQGFSEAAMAAHAIHPLVHEGVALISSIRPAKACRKRHEIPSAGTPTQPTTSSMMMMMTTRPRPPPRP